MKAKHIFRFILATGIFSTSCMSQTKMSEEILLKENWTIQSSRDIKGEGQTISAPGYKPENWYPATMPSTVLGALVGNKVYPDPYYGTNIESLPGYVAGRRAEMPEDSPYNVAWWYRTLFSLPKAPRGTNFWLKLHSINYKANIWLNGHLLADTTTIEGAYRLYNLNLTRFAIPGKNNCLALQIFPPKGLDLTITWVDWNPTPPDRGMGIWYDVSICSTGPVAIENAKVVTKLNLPENTEARLNISAELVNASGEAVSGILKGQIENLTFTKEVTLNPDERKSITFDPDQFKQLIISNPRLWWPYTVGTPNLYDLTLTFDIGGKTSDTEKTRFGIREISSWMNKFDGKLTRVFQVNGKNIVIRGGGYVQDMMLRPSDERIDTDIDYAKHMGLNALRMEAPRGSDYLFDKCDEEGILLMVGWCCCSSWERWRNWTPHIADIAELSWKDQIVHLRNHPSVFDWLYGSDNFPPADVEKRYINVLDKYDGTRPYESSATADSSAIAGYTGLYMGPYPKVYAYAPPIYWYGKLEFNTEAGPAGEQIPPVESMRMMMPEKDLWPISDSWNIRTHKAFYPMMRDALNSRYGTPSGLEEYSIKSQVLQYEATRAMFEAFAGNKYRSSGIIYWMYNSAWPSMYWQLYDYFFAPNGAFYGTKKACEPLHVQYTYDNNSVQVVNGLYKDFTGLKVTAKMYDLNMTEKYSGEAVINIKADESVKVNLQPFPAETGDMYFLKLELSDASGNHLSSNFYWLSSKGDEKADFTALNTLPMIKVNPTISGVKIENGKYSVSLEIENPSSGLAFAVNPKILKGKTKNMVLPVFWDDNYIQLLPHETRKMSVVFNASDLDGEVPLLVIDGWNIEHSEQELK
jgi:exo-1,4-beta-D-glucosaminidase